MGTLKRITFSICNMETIVILALAFLAVGHAKSHGKFDYSGSGDYGSGSGLDYSGSGSGWDYSGDYSGSGSGWDYSGTGSGWDYSGSVSGWWSGTGSGMTTVALTLAG